MTEISNSKNSGVRKEKLDWNYLMMLPVNLETMSVLTHEIFEVLILTLIGIAEFG